MIPQLPESFATDWDEKTKGVKQILRQSDQHNLDDKSKYLWKFPVSLEQ